MYYTGVNIQDQLNEKQDTISLTAGKVLISAESGIVAVSSITSTELGYLSGVSSNVQKQFTNIDNTLGDISTVLNSILGV